VDTSWVRAGDEVTQGRAVNAACAGKGESPGNPQAGAFVSVGLPCPASGAQLCSLQEIKPLAGSIRSTASSARGFRSCSSLYSFFRTRRALSSVTAAASICIAAAATLL
jgi:hypothetical protein